MVEHHNALPAGFEFDGYRVERVLGAGAFGITYLVRELNIGRMIAAKEYLPSDIAMRSGDGVSVHPIRTSDAGLYEYGLTSFIEEARTLVRFSHPNIVPFHRLMEANGTAYLMMEYQQGETLGDRLKRDGTLGIGELKALLFPLLDGLAEVHRQGFLHRDIKPDNIFLCADGQPMLIDFGAAREALGRQSLKPTAILTPGYAPFEQYSSELPQGPFTDIYAMAATVYRAAFAKKLPEATTRIARDSLVPAVEAGKHLNDERFLRAIDRGLAVQSADRPQTIEAWLEMFTRAAVAAEGRPADREEGGTIVTPGAEKETVPPRDQHVRSAHRQARGGSQRPLVLALAALLLLAGAAGGVWFYVDGGGRQVSGQGTDTQAARKAAERAARKAEEGRSPPKPRTPIDLSNTSLTVVSWGGAYTKSQVEAYHKPFMKKTGIKISSENYNGGITKIRSQVGSGNVLWDVVDLDPHELARACEDGLLEKIDHSTLPPAPDGTPATRDFIKGALHKCGVANIIWSTIYAYDRRRFQGTRPRTVKDFFDIKRFPGKRGMRKTPQVNLEWALIADGVWAEYVYKVLATREGQDRAFRKLDTIRRHIVWWESGAQPPQMLHDGVVVMSSAFSNRIFNASAVENKPFEIVWDHQIWTADMWGIVKGTRNLEGAMEFVRYSTDTKRLADQAKWISYGPARKSSIPLVGRYYDGSIDMKPYMPTAPENFRTAFASNYEFWARHKGKLAERFKRWLAR